MGFGKCNAVVSERRSRGHWGWKGLMRQTTTGTTGP